ncbi:MAG: hypothetical protein DLM60_20730 [Pseudonocardiales bacterium]|nr:MAG: hypothetical protein DLM60_20730 [Pseudonocardiales bacterium]
MTPAAIASVLTVRTVCNLPAVFVLVIFVVRTLRITLDDDDPLRLETGPPGAPIDWRPLESDHGSQRVTTHASHPGHAPGVYKDSRASLQNRAHGDRSTVDELVIGDLQVLGEVARREFMNVGRDLLNIDSIPTAPA